MPPQVDLAHALNHPLVQLCLVQRQPRMSLTRIREPISVLFVGMFLGNFCVTPALAGTFLNPGQVNAKDVESSLLSELEATFRPSARKERLEQLEQALRIMYTSLPKEQDGNIGHTTVRYALHRLFLQRHGWFIKGLESAPGGTVSIDANGDGDVSATAAPTLQDSLAGHVPEYLQSILEKRQKHTVDLRDLSVIAATLEDLIHTESIDRLKQVYKEYGHSESDVLNETSVAEVFQVYLTVYLRGGNITYANAKELKEKTAIFKRKYSDWKVVEDWMHDVQKEVAYLASLDGKRTKSGAWDFEAATRVVEAIGERFGSFNDGECGDLKKQLMSLEGPKEGRVTLADFYNSSRHSHWRFTEKVEYLRMLGALDESDPSQEHVIMTNYIGSRPNCLKASNFYEVCCRNECEDMMDFLEQKVAQPTADPDVILKLVSALPSATVKAPRTLSETMINRLTQMAEGHGGQVPLHGRLFAQWMHHAFPRECPYPHEDVANPQTPDEWMSENGHSSTEMSEDEIAKKVTSVKERCGPNGCGKTAALPWTQHERLLNAQPQFSKAKSTLSDRSIPRAALVLFGMLLSAGLAMLWITDSLPQKHEVRVPQIAGLVIGILGAYFCDLLHEELFLGTVCGGLFAAGLYKIAGSHLQLDTAKKVAEPDQEMTTNFGGNSSSV